MAPQKECMSVCLPGLRFGMQQCHAGMVLQVALGGSMATFVCSTQGQAAGASNNGTSTGTKLHDAWLVAEHVVQCIALHLPPSSPPPTHM